MMIDDPFERVRRARPWWWWLMPWRYALALEEVCALALDEAESVIAHVHICKPGTRRES